MVFLILEVHDMEEASAFRNPKDVAEAAKTAGGMEFEWAFVKNVEIHLG